MKYLIPLSAYTKEKVVQNLLSDHTWEVFDLGFGTIEDCRNESHHECDRSGCY